MITLHKEHGLNPTISKCILCGKDKNEIALLGNKYKDEAPMSMVISIEPCDICRNNYLSQGVMMVEMENKNQPNGNIAVIKDEAFKGIFNQDVPKNKIALCEPGLLRNIGAIE